MAGKKNKKPAKSPEPTPTGAGKPESDKTDPDYPAPDSRLKIARWEWIVLAIATLAGAQLRRLFFNSLTIEHFDEGVYASDIWFDADNNFQYPDRHLYAPPLLPELIEWMHIIFGPTTFAAFGVSCVFGCLTIPLIWWVGRRWFGPQAGLIAALLLATSDLQILYSRRALTEAMFCFWFLLGIYSGWESLHQVLREKIASRRSQLWAIAAGTAIGLCWLTKYNGWLPLAVLISGSVAFLIMSRSSAAIWKLVAGHLVLMAVIAGLFFGPYVWSLQEVGGYASVAANHKQYFVGFSGWWNSLVTQLATLGHFESYLSTAGFCTLPVVFISVFRMFRQDNSTTHHGENVGAEFWLLMAMVTGLVILSFVPLVFVSGLEGMIVLVLGVMICLGGFALLDFSRSGVHRTRNDGNTSGGELHSTQVNQKNWIPACAGMTGGGAETFSECNSLAFWLLAAWFFGLLIAIPLYTPYPRLMTPFLPAVFLGLGFVVQQLCHWVAGQNTEAVMPANHKVQSGAKFIVAVALLPPFLMITGMIVPNWSMAPQSLVGAGFNKGHEFNHCCWSLFRESLLEEKTSPRIIYVYGEPAVFYQLNAREMSDQTEALIGPVGNLDFAAPGIPPQPVPVFLVVGPHADKSPLFKEQWEKYGDHFELITEEKFTPSDFILLNDTPAWELRNPHNRDNFTQSLRLYKQKLK